MQEINLQFEKLYPLWEHVQTKTESVTGYEDDYSGATAKEYTNYVYNEYRWCGKNYRGQSNSEIIEIIRKWLKETYPRYRFSVRREHYNSFYIYLMQADFSPFKPEAGNIVHRQINHYSIKSNEWLTDRAKEIFLNVYEFIKSYHFDDSDSMTDYFNTNFYLHLGVGTYKNPYKTVIPKLETRKSDIVPQFKHPEGQAHKAIRQALGKNRFAEYATRGYGAMIALGYDSFCETGDANFYPLCYSARKTAQKRMDKLLAAGVRCKLSGYNGGYILFQGYSEETEKALENERREVTAAFKAWNEKKK